jgi:predicted component of type VI protein secretion system
MEKLVVLLNKEIVDELALDKGEVVLGRESSNDFQLNDSSVSRRHVKFIRIMADYLVEDLGSTNGISLNGKHVSKQMLKSGDIIKVGKFRLRYLKGEPLADGPAEAQAEEEGAKMPAKAAKQKAVSRKAMLHFVSGPDEGRIEELRKGLFTIGRPGEGVCTVTSRAAGFFLLHLGGELRPKVNSVLVEKSGAQLSDGDLIEVGEHRVRISIQSDG